MISEIIKYMRKASGMSQTELAKKLNIAPSTLSGYETKYVKPNFEIIEQIAKQCEYDIVFVDKNSGEKITTKNIGSKKKD